MASWADSSPPCARTISSRSNSIVTVRQHANWGYRFRVSVENSQKWNRSCGCQYKYDTNRLNYLGKMGSELIPIHPCQPGIAKGLPRKFTVTEGGHIVHAFVEAELRTDDSEIFEQKFVVLDEL